MGLELYTAQPDHFEAEDEGTGFQFPCCFCIHRHGTDLEEPCRSCGHNANCVSAEDSKVPNAQAQAPAVGGSPAAQC